MRTSIRSILVLAAAAVLTTAGTAPAQAAPEEMTQAYSGASAALPDSAPQLLEQAYSELLASSAPRTIAAADADGMISTTFTLPTGSTLTFETPEVDAQLGGGWDSRHGLYIELNRVDQGVILAGGGTALGIAMCAIPGVGIPLCAVTSGLIASAVAALAAHGVCGNIMRIYAQLFGYSECR
jgi:hypothetical protein